MATIGSALAAPESSWRRYNDTDSRIKYIGNFIKSSSSSFYSGSLQVSNIMGDKIIFKFYGTKLRLLSYMNVGWSDSVQIKIDSLQPEVFSMLGNGSSSINLCYEKLGLFMGIHTIEISTIKSAYFGIDAIDIDSTGYLVHPTLNQVQDINTMQVGDCIPCKYTATSGAAGYFSELGTCVANEIPVTGTATPDGLFYLIKTDKGTLIADRVIQTNISWDVLNSAKYIEGKRIDILAPTTFPFSSVETNSYYAITENTGQTSSRLMAWNVMRGSLGIYDRYLATYNTAEITFEILQNPICAKSYTLGNGYTDRSTTAPKDWVLLGSNDNLNWVELHSVSNSNLLIDGLAHSFNIENTSSYKYYKLKVLSTVGGANVTVCMFYLSEQVSSFNLLFRSLSGGVAYIDASGNSSTTDKSLGAWPSNNEWDKYVINSDLKGKITKGDDSIWHNINLSSWCKDTVYKITNPDSVVGNNACRTIRGGYTSSWWTTTKSNKNVLFYSTSTVSSTGGFRPVLNYIESDIANEVIY